MDGAARGLVKLATTMLSGGEERLFRKLLGNEPKDTTFLDVGCGFGRNLKLLSGSGFSRVVGVDVRQEAVDACKNDGFSAFHGEDEWAEIEAQGPFDALVVSHVIEHFSPDDLLAFLDRYLGLLREGGRVYVMTPTLGPAFFDDFDHVRPYTPSSLLNVFTADVRQVQYASNYALECEDLAFRRQPLLLGLTSRLRYLHRRSPRFLMLMAAVNAVPVAAYLASGGMVGRKTGWLGRFRLTGRAA
jgi:SAM-dependent methyltransferase